MKVMAAVLGLGLAGLVAFGVVVSLPDIMRYLKMRSM